jgi:hypothetical protein
MVCNRDIFSFLLNLRTGRLNFVILSVLYCVLWKHLLLKTEISNPCIINDATSRGKATKCLSSMDDVWFRTVVPHCPCSNGGFDVSTLLGLQAFCYYSPRKYIINFTAVTPVMMLGSLHNALLNEWTNPVNDQNQFSKLIHIIRFSYESRNFFFCLFISPLPYMFPFLNRHFPLAISSVIPLHESRFPNSVPGYGEGIVPLPLFPC